MSGEMDWVDTYSSGMAGYGATPFTLTWDSGAYVDSDGYLRASGYGYGGSFGTGTTGSLNRSSYDRLYKNGTNSTANYFKNPIDWSFSGHHGMVIDSDGKVWTAGNYVSYNSHGRGSSSSANTTHFTTIATGTGNYLPSTYTAVAVSIDSYRSSIILTSTGALYGVGESAYLGGAATETGTFTRLDTGTTSSGLPAATASNPIVDFGASGTGGSYVLYKDGSLYKGKSSTWTKMNPSGVTFKMFDADMENTSNRCYAVSTDNKIYYAAQSETTMTYLTTATGTVTQVRGAYNAWGYLNSENTLFLSSSSTSTAPTSSSAGGGISTTFYQISGVTYFDIGGNGSLTYGIIQNGVTKFWGSTYRGILGNGSTSGSVSYASPVTPSNVDTTYMPNLNRDISNTPPANCHFPRK